MSKSIKLKNNNYWDTKGITHNRELLSGIIPLLFRHYSGDIPDSDFNNVRRFGMYWIGALSDYQNCPAGYGLLIVFTSRGTTWIPSNQANWIWQIYLCGSNIYFRNAVNTETFTDWKTVKFE